MPYPATATLPPLFAVQRLADGQWLVRTPMGDPILPGSRQNHWRISSAIVQTRAHRRATPQPISRGGNPNTQSFRFCQRAQTKEAAQLRRDPQFIPSDLQYAFRQLQKLRFA